MRMATEVEMRYRLERFYTPEPTSGCWLWTGDVNAYGYGQMYAGKVEKRSRRLLAHRCAWELLRGPIPHGLELDHLCRNHACVNPDHLEPVTHAENMARSARARQTHCKHGHELTPENVLVRRRGPGGTWKTRRCRQCYRAENTRAYRKRMLGATTWIGRP